MSHGEDEGTAGDTAPGDTADLVSEPSLVVDFFGQGLSGRPMNFFPDTSDNVGVKPADAQMDGPGENGGEEEAHDGRDGEEVSASGIGGGDADVKEESVMAEILVNGLHHVESGGGVVVGPTEEIDPPKVVTPEQHAGESAHPPLDHGPEKIGSPQKRLDNGGENQRLGGAVHVEHHRRPPLSGSHGGGMPVQRPSEGPEGQPSRTGSGSGSGTGIVGDVLYSMGSEDEDGRSRQRILAFAAKRYSNAVERNPDDHDALYNWALVLQESADNTGPETGNSGKDALLEEACKKYEGATELCPTLHEAFYNWAIAISDRAKIRGRTKEAEDLWKQACERYDKSVQLNWNSPQALNNWGLALQELGAIVPLKEKRAIVKKAIRKFRSAIRLRFDFHRAVYNLGTVLYGLAEDTLRAGRKLTAKEPTPADLYSQSAIYIAAAHALKPDYPVYRSALRLVRSMLPLPFVKAGYLTIPPVGDSLAPHSDWQRLWFVLDHEALHEKEKLDRKSYSTSTRRTSGLGESSNASTSLRPSVLRIEMEDIVLMTPCADLSLPPGGGFRIDTLTGHQFLIADTWEAMDGWVDAIRLVYTIFARGKRDSLAGVLVG